MTSSSKSRRLLSHIWIWVTYSMIHTVWKRGENWDCSDVSEICWPCYMAHVGNTENSAKSKLWPLSLAVGPLIETVSLAQQFNFQFGMRGTYLNVLLSKSFERFVLRFRQFSFAAISSLDVNGVETHRRDLRVWSQFSIIKISHANGSICIGECNLELVCRRLKLRKWLYESYQGSTFHHDNPKTRLDLAWIFSNRPNFIKQSFFRLKPSQKYNLGIIENSESAFPIFWQNNFACIQLLVIWLIGYFRLL